MKTVTVRNIHFRPYIKWAVIAYFLFGVLTGYFEAIFAYLQTGSDLTKYLLWYGLGIPAIHLAVGFFGGSIFVLLYNSFSRSVGGYQIDIEIEDANDLPPPPPNDFDHIS